MRWWHGLGKRRQVIVLLCVCFLATTSGSSNNISRVNSDEMWSNRREARRSTRAERRLKTNWHVKQRLKAARWWRKASARGDLDTGERVGEASMPGPSGDHPRGPHQEEDPGDDWFDDSGDLQQAWGAELAEAAAREKKNW